MKIALSLPGIGEVDSGLPTGVPTGGLATGQNIIWTFIILAITVAVLLALWFLVKAGIDVITSGGSKENIKSARERIIFTLIGLGIIFLSIMMIQIVGALFGINLLSFPLN